MLDLIETLFSRYGIRSLRYDGKMSRGAREEVLMQFRKSSGLKVVLMRCVALTYAFARLLKPSLARNAVGSG